MDLFINTEMFGKQFVFREKCIAAKTAGFCGLEIWVEELNFENINTVIEYDLEIISLIGLKGWFEGDGSLMGVSDNWDSILHECQRRIDLAAQFSIKNVICVPSRSDRGRFNSIKEGSKRYKKILEYATSMEVNLLFEFVGASQQVNDIEKLNLFYKEVEDEKMSAVIDSYHLWRSGTDCVSFPLPYVKLLHASSFNFQIPRQIHRDRDRVFPEVGRFNWGLFFDMFKNKPISLGAYNRGYWKLPPIIVANASMQAILNVMQCKCDNRDTWDLV